MNEFKDSVYREMTLPTKKEVTNVATALNEENEKLTGRIRALEAEVRGLKKVESWQFKAWKEIKWWYGMNCHDYVVTIAKHAAAVLVGHNHPSGNKIESSDDRAITEKIKKALETVDIKNFHDHIIVVPGGDFTSFADKGLI